MATNWQLQPLFDESSLKYRAGIQQQVDQFNKKWRLNTDYLKDPNFIVKVKQFLAAGLSDSPVNIFRKMDIDITKKDFWQTGLLEVDRLLKQTEKLAQKLDKV